MQLTQEQQKMSDGEFGEAQAQAMRILVALGKIYKAENLISISSAQVSGVSYETIGDAGLEYLQDYVKKNAKVKVLTFLNPAGMDRDQWQKMSVPAVFAKKQIQILDAFKSMGITMSCTCAPYHIGIRPKVGEHIAWAESSAVAFSNSVLGARTNREGGPSALAAAITGLTPNYGLHLDENRFADIIINVKAKPKTTADFGAMGSYLGAKLKASIPAFTNLKQVPEIKLKTLGASMAATGSTALFYIKGITPEYKVNEGAEKINFTQEELISHKKDLNIGEKPDLVTIGCPHASLEEIKEVAQFLNGKKIAHKLWVCTAKKTKELSDVQGFTKIIETAGGLVVADTCMVVSPLNQMGFKCTACNSGKAAKYLASLQKQKVVFGDIEDIILAK
ncbi:MAG: aconitase X catalytic domain-containing protein [Candidatus Micrarchaeia archaeon]